MKKGEKTWMATKNHLGSYKNITLGEIFTNQVNVGHLPFTLARYHFVSRLIEGIEKSNILELGCGEGVAAISSFPKIAKKYTGVDFDKDSIDNANRVNTFKNMEFINGNFLDEKFGDYNAVISIDVIEHIEKSEEPKFIATIKKNLVNDGYCIIGTPNKTAEKYASAPSKLGHINTYESERLEKLISNEFKNVFMFGMNDTVMHTGFKPMAHYLFCLGCNKIS